MPALTRIVKQATASLEMAGTPPSPGVASLFSAGRRDGIYITYDQGRIFLVTTHPPVTNRRIPPTIWKLLKNALFPRHVASGDVTGDAIERLRQLIQETQTEVPGVNVGLTGEPVLDYDEMTQSQKDITLASIVSLVLCALDFHLRLQRNRPADQRRPSA